MRGKGIRATGSDGLRLCATCRRNPDRVWLAVYLGHMTLEEALLKYPYIEDEEEAS